MKHGKSGQAQPEKLRLTAFNSPLKRYPSMQLLAKIPQPPPVRQLRAQRKIKSAFLGFLKRSFKDLIAIGNDLNEYKQLCIEANKAGRREFDNWVATEFQESRYYAKTAMALSSWFNQLSPQWQRKILSAQSLKSFSRWSLAALRLLPKVGESLLQKLIRGTLMTGTSLKRLIAGQQTKTASRRSRPEATEDDLKNCYDRIQSLRQKLAGATDELTQEALRLEIELANKQFATCASRLGIAIDEALGNCKEPVVKVNINIEEEISRRVELALAAEQKNRERHLQQMQMELTKAKEEIEYWRNKVELLSTPPIATFKIGQKVRYGKAEWEIVAIEGNTYRIKPFGSKEPSIIAHDVDKIHPISEPENQKKPPIPKPRRGLKAELEQLRNRPETAQRQEYVQFRNSLESYYPGILSRMPELNKVLRREKLELPINQASLNPLFFTITQEGEKLGEVTIVNGFWAFRLAQEQEWQVTKSAEEAVENLIF